MPKTSATPPPEPPDEHTDEVHAALAAISVATALLDAREPTDALTRIERWQAADAVLTELKTVVSQMGGDAVNAMVELGREAMETSLGPVHTAPGYGREEWDGSALLGTLAVPRVDTTTGEVEDVIPVSVLRDVLPAVGPGATSSKWKVSGLRKHGIRVDSYRRSEPAPMVIRNGVPYR